ncbi:MAG: hypothetical protein ACE14S_12055 [Candidatus Bathyarchaeia archaeon]
MKHGIKLVIAAVLSLSVGVVFAAPLYIADMNIHPFTGVRQGPKADFTVSVVYANFSVHENEDPEPSPGSVNLNVVDYFVVLNVTNLSEAPAKVAMLKLGAAEDFTVNLSVLGSEVISASSGVAGGYSSAEAGLVVEGVWLDDEWLNVTWIPGNYSDGLGEIYASEPHNAPSQRSFPTTIPDLPADAIETGYWIEGVPVTERTVVTSSGDVMTEYTAIYVNGSWIDVTGRVRAEYPQPNVMASNTFVYETLHVVSDSYYTAIRPRNMTSPYITQGMSVVYSGPGRFDKEWQPAESRLIMLKGTRYIGNTGGLQALASGDMMLYSAVCSYLKDKEEMNETLVNTYATAFDLKQVQLGKTTEGYQYSAVLGSDFTFEPDEFGVEVFIKPRS